MRRILILLTIAALFGSTLLAGNCLETSRARPLSYDAPASSDGDDGCCAYCFCCHCSGVVIALDAAAPPVAIPFVPEVLKLPLDHIAIVPQEQPPRT